MAIHRKRVERMAKVEYELLKKDGFMSQVQKGCFSMRLRSVGGQISVEELNKISQIAQEYGEGYIHLTSRQGIEIPFIKLEDIDIVRNELSKAGLETGACGARLRTVTACQGITICPSGLIDTTALAKELDQRYFAQDLPHKFKLGVTGCQNNCLKAEENDLGIKGGMQPSWEKLKCSFCGLCKTACPQNAIKVDKEDSKLVYAEEKCINCGKCVKSCPVGAWQGKRGFFVFFGGRLANKIATGKQLLPLIHEKEELYRIIDASLAFFTKYGRAGERFSLTIERIGWDVFKKEL